MTEDSWEFGISGGMGYSFNENLSSEIRIDNFDNADNFSIGLQFEF